MYGSNYIKQHCTRKLLRFEITKMLIAVLKNKFNVSLIIIFSTRYTNRIVSTVVDSVPLRRSSCTFHWRVASPSATALSQSPQLAFGTVCHLFSVVTLLQFLSLGQRYSSSPRLSLLSLLTNTLPGPSASEVTTLWRYTNQFIIIIITFVPYGDRQRQERRCGTGREASVINTVGPTRHVRQRAGITPTQRIVRRLVYLFWCPKGRFVYRTIEGGGVGATYVCSWAEVFHWLMRRKCRIIE